ncbi:MAG: hypothetical protein HN411_04430 [Waddliaceae bacterium]|nr:hypothetical protein [Waddliaceae bacterium]MBT3579332.1 hypothetical protein [Waddliaceae bacterium]MBT4445463.1 hypothetical protein [Waddliaceae bacterium]MBT6928861.1 hypothetical protein [Waddliaceae bacterium]MBT7265204.1 hypothetical protein [Waddliaceae bacterium]
MNPKNRHKVKPIAPKNTKKACSLVITCQEPNDDGNMHVEMTCEGDTTLAAYLLEEAQYYLKI